MPFPFQTTSDTLSQLMTEVVISINSNKSDLLITLDLFICPLTTYNESDPELLYDWLPK